MSKSSKKAKGGDPEVVNRLPKEPKDKFRVATFCFLA